MRVILTLLACLACAAAVAGEVYKWKDAEGRVHYGDKPKQGGEAVEIRGTGGKGPALHDPEDVKAAAAHDTECKHKKAQLESYLKAPGIKEVDNLGRTREYSAEERQQLIDQTEKQMNAACNPQASPATAAK